MLSCRKLYHPLGKTSSLIVVTLLSDMILATSPAVSHTFSGLMCALMGLLQSFCLAFPEGVIEAISSTGCFLPGCFLGAQANTHCGL